MSFPVRRPSALTSASTLLLVGSLSLAAAPVRATDGYFVPGYGVKAQGQGGASVAWAQDSLAAASNPAGRGFVGERFDLGGTLFRPIRYGSIAGNQLPPGYPNVNGEYDANGKTVFAIPELGYNHLLSPRLSLGVSIFGNGGLNTTYTTPILLLGGTNAGVDLQQLFVSPSVSWKVSDKHAVGVAVNLLYQRFKATGLENFASPGFSTAPDSVTNNGYASSGGAGVRVGYLGELGSALTLGATYQTKTKASKFDEYAGLFAEQGGFDVPANFAFGLSLKASPAVTVGLDVQRILYGGVPSIANSGSNQAPLGSDGGPGFGWRDITVVKAGIAWKASESLTLRGGYNHSGQPIPETETFFNLLAPGVVQHHATLGLTWRLDGGKELNLAYVHVFETKVQGASSIPPTAGGGNANLRMHQDSVAIGFGWSRK